MTMPVGGLRLMVLLVAGLVLSACTVRSISNSGYQDRYGYGRDNPLYQGELTEFDVLGIDLNKSISHDDIAREFAAYARPSVNRGSAVMVIQSGAMIPDEPMTRALDHYFATTPFSGVPLRRRGASADTNGAVEPNYATALRLAAARGGYETIFCYWGVLETAVENHVTKAVSWVPIVGAAIPDETQQMRIRLKVALIDVKTGRWSIFAPNAYEDRALSASFGRRESDESQVALLKEKAYKSAVADFVKKYVQ